MEALPQAQVKDKWVRYVIIGILMAVAVVGLSMCITTAVTVAKQAKVPNMYSLLPVSRDFRSRAAADDALCSHCVIGKIAEAKAAIAEVKNGITLS